MRALGNALRTGALAATVLLVALLAGCGGSASGQTPAAARPTPSPNAAALWTAYAQCLRSQGFAEPDPTIDNHGQPHFQVPVDTAPAATKQACVAVQQRAISPGGPVSATRAAELAQGAQCMRQNGFPTFPDPDPDTGAFKLTGTGIAVQSPQFQTAAKQCFKGGGNG